jgi:hypothetical protein
MNSNEQGGDDTALLELEANNVEPKPNNWDVEFVAQPPVEDLQEDVYAQ